MIGKRLDVLIVMWLMVAMIPEVCPVAATVALELGIPWSPQRAGMQRTYPDDAHFDFQYALHNTGQTGGVPDADIDGPEAWDLETANSDVIIAFMDTGIDYTHPDLAENIWINPGEIPGNGIDDDANGYIDDIRGWNFYDDNNEVLDLNGHGTVCAGIAAAVSDNGAGGSPAYAGIAVLCP